MKNTTLTKGDTRGAFFDLFDENEAAELTMRAQILDALQQWMEKQRKPQSDIGTILGITQPRVSKIKNGHVEQLSLDKLVRIAQRAGLKLKLEIAAKA
jgi:predicted XRE-type DNA-binding protein